MSSIFLTDLISTCESATRLPGSCSGVSELSMNPERCNINVEHYPHDWGFELLEGEGNTVFWAYKFCDGLVWL